MSKIYILLPVHNRKKITHEFIRCLKTQKYKNYHLVLIDDGSIDGTAEMVGKQITDLTVIRGDGDLWWGGALHKGYEWLEDNNVNDDDIVLISNDDVEFESDYLLEGVAAIDNTLNSLICSRLYEPETRQIKESGISADLKRLVFSPAKDATDINCCPTRGLFIRWVDMRKIGGFHPTLLPHYLSDYEYTIRAKRKGLQLLTTNKVYLCPDHSKTGVHGLATHGFISTLKLQFSNKYAGNPIHWSTFAILVSPPIWLPYILMRVWAKASFEICKSLIRTF